MALRKRLGSHAMLQLGIVALALANIVAISSDTSSVLLRTLRMASRAC